MNADEMAEFVSGIIEKSGGIGKWRLLSMQLRSVKQAADSGSPERYKKYLKAIAEGREEGAKQFVAIALLGLTLGEVVYEGNKRRKKKQAEGN